MAGRISYISMDLELPFGTDEEVLEAVFTLSQRMAYIERDLQVLAEKVERDHPELRKVADGARKAYAHQCRAVNALGKAKFIRAFDGLLESAVRRVWARDRRTPGPKEGEDGVAGQENS